MCQVPDERSFATERLTQYNNFELDLVHYLYLLNIKHSVANHFNESIYLPCHFIYSSFRLSSTCICYKMLSFPFSLPFFNILSVASDFICSIFGVQRTCLLNLSYSVVFETWSLRAIHFMSTKYKSTAATPKQKKRTMLRKQFTKLATKLIRGARNIFRSVDGSGSSKRFYQQPLYIFICFAGCIAQVYFPIFRLSHNLQ